MLHSAPMNKNLLPLQLAIKRSGIPCQRSTPCRWVREGRLPSAIRVGGRWFVDPADFQLMISKPAAVKP